jgi:hypothetical protein
VTWRHALALLSLVTLLIRGWVLAQENPGAENRSRLVSSEECAFDPRASEEIAAMLALDGDGVPAPATTSLTPPFGELASGETTAAIQQTVRQILACFNAGDIPRAAGMMTEAGVRRAYWGMTIDQPSRNWARLRIESVPEARSEGSLIRLIAVTDVTVLADGRIAAFVVLNEPLLPPGGPETLLFVYVHEDGHWLLDDLIDFTIVPVVPREDASLE